MKIKPLYGIDIGGQKAGGRKSATGSANGCTGGDEPVSIFETLNGYSGCRGESRGNSAFSQLKTLNAAADYNDGRHSSHTFLKFEISNDVAGSRARSCSGNNGWKR